MCAGTLAGVISSWKEQHGTKRTIPESKIWGWATQLLAALTHCHGLNIVHRDIKPANIFLTNKDQLKLGDFGIAKNKSRSISFSTQHKGMVGTPYYLSPEVRISLELSFHVRGPLHHIAFPIFDRGVSTVVTTGIGGGHHGIRGGCVC